MIDVTKQYKTRDGREVTQLTVFKTEDLSYPVMGIIDGVFHTWTVRGSYGGTGVDHNDLIEVKPRIKRDVWVNVYETECVASDSRERADRVRNESTCIACVKLTIDCEQGEGL